MTPLIIRLPRLPTGWQDQPQLLERYWDEAMTAIEKSLNAVLAIPDIQHAIEAANAAAANANTAAGNAQASAEAAAATSLANSKEQSLVNSYVSGFTGSLLSSTDSGVITVMPHSRVYGDQTLNPTVTVGGGTVTTTGTAAGSVVRIFYDDPTRTGGTVTYQYTIDPAAPPVQGGNRHSVGVVTIPDMGNPPTDGENIKPPGYVPNKLSTE